MERPWPSRSGRIDRVWIGLLVSGLVHAAGVAALVKPGSESAGSDSARADDDVFLELPPEPEQTRLGIAESRQVTVNWLGYADPTPNTGLPSDIEQAAMSVVPVGVPVEDPSEVANAESEPGDSAVNAEAVAEAPPAEPADSPSEGDTRVVENEPSQEPNPASTIEESVEPAEAVAAAGPTPVGTEIEIGLPEPVEASDETGSAEADETVMVPTDAEPGSEVVKPRAERDAGEPEHAEPTAEPVSPSRKASEAGGGPSGGDDLPGAASDKESEPTAKEPVVMVDDWGKPAAGEGIEVIPRRPRWGPTIATVAMPRSPTVLVEFDRTGRVRNASFVKENGKTRSTGSVEVDRVLLNSIYNWRAKGKKIESLPAEGPGSLFRLRMHIRLRM